MFDSYFQKTNKVDSYSTRVISKQGYALPGTEQKLIMESLTWGF